MQPRVDVVTDQAYLRRYYESPPPPLPHHTPPAGEAAGAAAQPPLCYHELAQRFAKLPGWQHYRSSCLEDNAMGQGGWGAAAMCMPRGRPGPACGGAGAHAPGVRPAALRPQASRWLVCTP